MKLTNTGIFVAATALVCASGCSDDDSPKTPGDGANGDVDSGSGSANGSNGSGGPTNGNGSNGNQGNGSANGTSSGADASPGDDASAGTLCAKYGGPSVIMGVMQNQVLGEIAADCRINAFFANLSDDGLTHVGECLGIMAQELFECPGVTYAGSMSSVGAECRDMKSAHAGLKISKGDFDALLEDVVAGLAAAGVEQDDIMAAAPALVGMEDDIVEEPASDPSKAVCMMDGGPTNDGSMDGSASGVGSTDAGNDGG